MSETHGTYTIEEAHRRLEQLKETHKSRVFEKREKQGQLEPEGLKTQSFNRMMKENRHRIISEVIEDVQEFFPEPEAEEVRRYRSLILAIDTVRKANIDTHYGSPVQVIERVAMGVRDEARAVIEDRLVLESPIEEEDADVVYIYDPISKIRHTTALGGYKKEYDEALIAGQKSDLAEQILTEPLPDTVPRV